VDLPRSGFGRATTRVNDVLRDCAHLRLSLLRLFPAFNRIIPFRRPAAPRSFTLEALAASARCVFGLWQHLESLFGATRQYHLIVGELQLVIRHHFDLAIDGYGHWNRTTANNAGPANIGRKPASQCSTYNNR